jgi:hypothetical protein
MEDYLDELDKFLDAADEKHAADKSAGHTTAAS